LILGLLQKAGENPAFLPKWS